MKDQELKIKGFVLKNTDPEPKIKDLERKLWTRNLELRICA